MTEFYKLPDSIGTVRIRECFEEFLLCYSNNSNYGNVNYALSELLELADRQWHTYELLEECTKEKVGAYLKSVIDFEDEEIMDYILCIIPRIGLGNLFNYILQNKDNIRNKNVLSNIKESENEYGDNVNNPYSGM